MTLGKEVGLSSGHIVLDWDVLKRLKRAARGSLQIQDAKSRQKVTIWAPSHKFVGLYLRN